MFCYEFTTQRAENHYQFVTKFGCCNYFVEAVGIEPTSETQFKARPTCVVLVYRLRTRLSGLRETGKPRRFFYEVYPAVPRDLVNL